MEAGDYRRDGFLSSHSRAVSSMDFSFDGRFLGSGSLDQSIRVWSLETGQSLATFQTDGGAIKSVAFSPDGRRLASGSLNGRVRLWGLAMAQGIAPVRNPWFPALKEVFDRNGQPVLSPDGHQIPDSPKGRPRIRRESRGEVDQIVRQAFSPDGRRFATVYSSGTIEVLGGKQGLTVLASKDRDRLAEKAELAFSPDGRRLAANVFGDPIKILDTVTGKTLVTLEDSRGSSNSLVFSPDGRQLASALGNDVHLWDIARAKKITIFQGRESARSLAFSPDGRRLAFGSDDRTIQVFDLGNHRLLATLQGHTGPVFSVKFSPDGQRLASGSEDRTIRLWDLANYQPEATLFGHQETVTSLAFTPDGRRLASSSADGTIRYWLTSLPESLQSPQTRADSFAKIYEASLQELRYRPDELDFDPIEDSIDETPSFAFRRPRPLDQDLLEWLLEVGEALPKEPVDSFPSRAVLFQKH
jgi:WD40 repeat protein